MHPTRSPSSIPTGVPDRVLDLSLTGTQLSLSKRPSSASSGKYFRSVSVAGDSRAKRNTQSDASSRAIKNLRRSNSTTQVNQQDNSTLSQERNEDNLALIDSSLDRRKKVSTLSKVSPDRTTWNMLDDQPRLFSTHSGPRSTRSVDTPTASQKKREPGVTLAATFTANNRSNKGTVGNSVTTILHNNYSEKPLTPKSSNQKPSFNNILKATANDDVSLERSSLTKSQKNFSSSSSTSNRKTPASASGRREVTEEDAERFVQQVNEAAVTIQRWYRRHARRQHANQAALKHILATKRRVWQERAEEERRLEQQKHEDRKHIREEKTRLARLAAIQELQQKRAQRVAGAELTAEAERQSRKQTAPVGRRKPPKVSLSNKSPVSPSNNIPVSPTDIKAKNTDSNLNLVADFVESSSVRAVSPVSSIHRGSQFPQEFEDGADGYGGLQHQPENDRKLMRVEKRRLIPISVNQGLQQTRAQLVTEAEPAARVTCLEGHKKPPKISPSNKSPVSPSINSPVSPIDIKAKNTDHSNLNIVADFGDASSFRALSPALSSGRGSREMLQRLVSAEDQRQGVLSTRPQSKATLTEVLDTLKLLEEEPERLKEPRFYQKEKHAWIDEDEDSNSLTTDNVERNGQLVHHPALPDGGALLSEAKLQSIMSFLDEMEKSEQERPRSTTSGSHREAVLSEEDLAGIAAADGSGSMMRIKLELDEKKHTVTMLQTALAQQEELTGRLVKETEKEMSRNLQLQKEHYEATIKRHLSFIDQLIGDKTALTERCEVLVGEVKQVDQKYTKKIEHMQEQQDVEIKKLKDLMSAKEKVRREKWIEEKSKQIKEITVKGLEPEIQKLILKHKQDLKKLQTLHEAELLQAEDKAAQLYVHKVEELHQQLEKEKEELYQRDRELARLRQEKLLQEEELQQQRRRLYQEVADEKERLTQLAARQRAELEDLQKQLEENNSLAVRVLREELDKTREEHDRRHQEEMKALKERLDIDKQMWEENYKKKEDARLLSREHELREQLRRERDKEIELAIWTLEAETSKEKEECKRTCDNRVKRLREKHEADERELERSERAAVEKQQELRKKQMEMEEELLRLQGVLRQKEQELENVTQIRDKLAEERHNLAEVIRQEFADQLVRTEEENCQMKAEVSEARARLRLEVERLTAEKEEELGEVQQRVKSAILKKEETVNNLRKQLEVALKRAGQLEAILEKQRKLEK
ncbi:centrosomal protein of 131 kDa isoform X2 [Thalassophryne amazonica]|uniref:centrosomal protein of 131 kDa isoform X2 n=1 Tax=Thalassophryne amazonica TaxID=390379 RepID=UPI001471CA98|nr:centrosomal protein of 131 kDa isoform X2 [Thalassophryne amazonica]